jgi:AraC-like DNA-binding protein
LGSLQGLIVSSLLFFSKKKRSSNRLLAMLILLITLASFNLYGGYHNWFDSRLLHLIAELVPLVVVMPLGPLIWFYVQSSLDPAFRITKKQRRHFYPVLIDLVPSLTAIIYFIGIMTKLIHKNPAPWGAFIDDFNVYADIPRWFSITFYLWLSARYLSAYKLRNNGSLNGQTNYFKWLQQFLGAFAVFQGIWLVYLVPYVIPRYTNIMLDTFDWYPIYIPMAILIYWLGIKGYLISQQQIVSGKKIAATTAALTPEYINRVIAVLTKAMEVDKIYLDPGLNLAVMAKATGLPQKTISAVLNQHLQKSFNEFVNQFRVKEFTEKIFQPGMNNLTLAGVALECGFNSQATFQRTFKEFTGKSPSEYRKLPLLAIDE